MTRLKLGTNIALCVRGNMTQGDDLYEFLGGRASLDCQDPVEKILVGATQEIFGYGKNNCPGLSIHQDSSIPSSFRLDISLWIGAEGGTLNWESPRSELRGWNELNPGATQNFGAITASEPASSRGQQHRKNQHPIVLPAHVRRLGNPPSPTSAAPMTQTTPRSSGSSSRNGTYRKNEENSRVMKPYHRNGSRSSRSMTPGSLGMSMGTGMSHHRQQHNHRRSAPPIPSPLQTSIPTPGLGTETSSPLTPHSAPAFSLAKATAAAIAMPPPPPPSPHTGATTTSSCPPASSSVVPSTLNESHGNAITRKPTKAYTRQRSIHDNNVQGGGSGGIFPSPSRSFFPLSSYSLSFSSSCLSSIDESDDSDDRIDVKHSPIDHTIGDSIDSDVQDNNNSIEYMLSTALTSAGYGNDDQVDRREPANTTAAEIGSNTDNKNNDERGEGGGRDAERYHHGGNILHHIQQQQQQQASSRQPHGQPLQGFASREAGTMVPSSILHEGYHGDGSNTDWVAVLNNDENCGENDVNLVTGLYSGADCDNDGQSGTAGGQVSYPPDHDTTALKKRTRQEYEDIQMQGMEAEQEEQEKEPTCKRKCDGDGVREDRYQVEAVEEMPLLDWPPITSTSTSSLPASPFFLPSTAYLGGNAENGYDDDTESALFHLSSPPPLVFPVSDDEEENLVEDRFATTKWGAQPSAAENTVFSDVDLDNHRDSGCNTITAIRHGDDVAASDNQGAGSSGNDRQDNEEATSFTDTVVLTQTAHGGSNNDSTSLKNVTAKPRRRPLPAGRANALGGGSTTKPVVTSKNYAKDSRGKKRKKEHETEVEQRVEQRVEQQRPPKRQKVDAEELPSSMMSRAEAGDDGHDGSVDLLQFADRVGDP